MATLNSALATVATDVLSRIRESNQWIPDLYDKDGSSCSWNIETNVWLEQTTQKNWKKNEEQATKKRKLNENGGPSVCWGTQDEKDRIGQIEDLEEQKEKLKKDNVTLQNEKTRLENDAKIEAVRMKAVEDQLLKAEAQCLFYQTKLFPVQTPAHGATQGASISMAGGGGNRGLSPAAFFASPVD